MSYHQHRCPNCGAPLLPPPPSGTVRCAYCTTMLAPSAGGWRPVAPPEDEQPVVDPERPRLWLGGVRYAILGRLGVGAGSDVFLARRDGRIAERVVVKVLRAPSAADLLERGHETLRSLEAFEGPGADLLQRVLPRPIAHGLARLGLRGDEGERLASIVRYRGGFSHTLEAVRAAHAGGVESAHAVWMWKRVLDVLFCLHQAGWVHGAVLPSHLLVHARDHGVAPIGFSAAARIRERAPARSLGLEAFYPREVRETHAPATPWHDVVMSARVVAYVLGADAPSFALPASVPAPIASLVAEVASFGEVGATSTIAPDATSTKGRLDAASREVFGPPRFVPFSMPGGA